MKVLRIVKRSGKLIERFCTLAKHRVASRSNTKQHEVQEVGGYILTDQMM
jgi:hypothetical protein